jgi:dihydroorotate dehydrogenase electron transfer subunit
MLQHLAPITAFEQVADNVFTLEFEAEPIARRVEPGQFLNIKPDGSLDPLLRRAYSVHRVRGSRLEIIFNVVGKGSSIFARKRPGDLLDVLGPLGVPFHLDGAYDTAVLVSGGVGIAPMPILGEALAARGTRVVNIHGARTASLVVNDGRLIEPVFATDDGSLGIRGNVVGALGAWLEGNDAGRVRVFACGPNRMLEALGAFCQTRSIPVEVSLECQMACGVGICQGCPVEMAPGSPRKYTLVCTHGPNYEFGEIVLSSLPAVH